MIQTLRSFLLAIDQARTGGAGSVGTEHLLCAMLTEGTNLALRVLRAMEIEPDHVSRALTNALPAPQGSADNAAATQFRRPAANALELTATEAIALRHNYVGCEHLLLGLISETEGTAGTVLRDLAIDLRTTRQTIVAALTGYTHLRTEANNTSSANAATMFATAVRQELRPIIDRIERLEQQTDLTAER